MWIVQLWLRPRVDRLANITYLALKSKNAACSLKRIEVTNVC